MPVERGGGDEGRDDRGGGVGGQGARGRGGGGGVQGPRKSCKLTVIGLIINRRHQN